MISMTINEIVNIVDGQSIAMTEQDVSINQICIDSREITADCLFIALVGDKFDGHDFAKQAILSGAKVVLVNHKIDDVMPQIVVKDTHAALGKLAAWVRSQSSAKVVALTGSSGKTSVKEMTAAILAQCGRTLFTKGNFNNDIGVPLTLLRLTPQDEYAVIELGANHIGEIQYTTQLVKPQSALINNISEAHLQGFGSLDGVAKAKSEIFLGLPEKGVAIINLDCYRKEWLESLKHKTVMTFSLLDTQADFYAKTISHREQTHFILCTPIGEVTINLSLLGLHNVANAIAAAALAISVGANLQQIKEGLKLVQPVKGRLYPIKLNDDQLILDDSYNANIGSMTAAIHVLAAQKGYRILVVGDMAELGVDSAKLHQKVGEEAQRAHLDCVVSVGQNSRLISQYSNIGHHFNDKDQATAFLRQLLTEHAVATILVKGSRSSKMEQIINNINNYQD